MKTVLIALIAITFLLGCSDDKLVSRVVTSKDISGYYMQHYLYYYDGSIDVDGGAYHNIEVGDTILIKYLNTWRKPEVKHYIKRK